MENLVRTCPVPAALTWAQRFVPDGFTPLERRELHDGLVHQLWYQRGAARYVVVVSRLSGYVDASAA